MVKRVAEQQRSRSARSTQSSSQRARLREQKFVDFCWLDDPDYQNQAALGKNQAKLSEKFIFGVRFLDWTHKSENIIFPRTTSRCLVNLHLEEVWKRSSKSRRNMKSSEEKNVNDSKK
jgi:hypothetical protein